MEMPASLPRSHALLVAAALLGSTPLLAQTAAPPSQVTVGIVVQNGMEILDFAGPAEVFAAAGSSDARPFRVFTVGATPAPVTSQGFVKIVPDYTIANA